MPSNVARLWSLACLVGALPSCSCSSANVGADADLDATDPREQACEQNATSAFLRAHIDGLEVVRCSPAAVGSVTLDATPTGPGAWRQWVLITGDCPASAPPGSCPTSVSPLCTVPGPIELHNTPLVSAATGALATAEEVSAARWSTAFTSLVLIVERPDVLDPMTGLPAACDHTLQANVTGALSGSYEIVQGGGPGDFVVIEVRDVVVDAPPGHSIVIDLIRYRARLDAPALQLP